MRTITALLFAMAFASSVHAQHVCFNPSRSWYEYQTAPCTTDELHQFAYLCDVVRNLPNCNPPATLSYRPSPIPYSAPTTYGGEVKDHGVVLWRWIKAGDAARACTATEQSMPGYAFACNVKVGELLYLTQRAFFNPSAPKLAATNLFAAILAQSDDAWAPQVVCAYERLRERVCTPDGCYECTSTKINPRSRYRSDPSGAFLIEERPEFWGAEVSR